MDATIHVYLDFGCVYSYVIKNCTQNRAKEHVDAISRQGYDRVNDDGGLEHFPAHRILKIKVTGIVFDPMYRESGSKVT